jgi:two-component system phosphate regulon sensor histidine kinase PhoR
MLPLRLFLLLRLAQLMLGGAILVLLTLAMREGQSGDSAIAGLYAVLALALLGAFFAINPAANAARDTIRPLHDIAQAMDRLSEGAYGVRVYSHGPEDAMHLGDSFNRMSADLTTRIALLEEERERLRAILGGMVEGVVALDAGQYILFANERAARLLNLGDGAVERRLWEVVRHRPLLDVVRQAMDRPDPVQAEVTLDGTSSRSLTVHAARLPGAAARGAVIVLHDTTELRRLERLRQEFVANVSHELKTPLSVITACAETLLNGAADDLEARGRFLDQIAEQSARLNRLILDLLSLARLESGDELFEFHAVPVRPAVVACIERHRPRAVARKQTLDIAGDGLVAAWADPDGLDHILDNLLDNAVKYTPDGGRITVAWRADGDEVCLEVADTGIGIPATDLPHVFERFYRVDKARSRELGGTGLGLSIVKHLVQTMHGSVGVTSQVGEGTTFAVRLPREAVG